MEALALFSEFSLALAGFSAIALVLGQRRDAIPAGAAFVVRFMVVNALGPGLLALLAIVLLQTDLAPTTIWRLCSAIYLVGATYFALLSLQQQRQLAIAGELLLSNGLVVGLWGGAIVAHLTQLSNAIGFPFEPSLALLLAGLWVLVTVAGIQFVALLFTMLR